MSLSPEFKDHLEDRAQRFREEREKLLKISERYLLKSYPPGNFKQFQAWLKIRDLVQKSKL